MRVALKFGHGQERIKIGVTGVTGGVMDSTLVQVHLRLRFPGSLSAQSVQTLGLRRLDIWTPSRQLDSHSVQLFKDLSLADPRFDLPRGVDMVLGADIYASLIRPGILVRGGMLAQQTVFGWTITGKEQRQTPASKITSCSLLTSSPTESWHEVLIALMQRFWATEEVPRAVRQSPDDLACEALFQARHCRAETGRYSVPLPTISETLELLGENLDNARKVLRSVQRRMQQDPHFRDEYLKFMDEYLQLGHMRLLTATDLEASYPRAHYLPHHGIWQTKDDGRRLRVVFNASCSTTSGCCLNDALQTGPKLQSYLPSVVTRWRRWRIAYCADIKMMFRQIRINSEHTHLQRIVWSPSPEHPEMHFELKTVTYGMSSSPYLARRTLKQLCTDEGHAFPDAVQAVENELYVDDFLSGADLVSEALHKRNQLIQLLRLGCFELKKWVSNEPQIIADIPVEDRLRPDWLHLASEGPVNELGIRWDPVTDCLRFQPPTPNDSDRLTKRQVLSEIARLFDPAGWLSPVVVSAKMFMQDLWRARLDWDTDLPASESRQWRLFRSNLEDVSAITVNRWFHWTPSCGTQLHAFADASRRVIAATVYLRTESDSGSAVATIVMAKTKLASLKSLSHAERPSPRMTIPRLELRAALLAAQLLHSLSRDLCVNKLDCHAWSDSKIVLQWLKSDKSLGNDLVDNYVSHVHEVMPLCHWHYVNTTENPADIATRGATPSNLAHNRIWWCGPAWLTKPSTLWPSPTLAIAVSSPAQKAAMRPLNCFVTQNATDDVVDRFSCLTRLLRTLARCCRIFKRRANHEALQPLNPITAKEIRDEFLGCVRQSQQHSYHREIEELKRGQPVSKSSPLRTLCPFLDDVGVLRVDGRLQGSNLPYDERHPVILDGKCHLAELVIDWAHTRALHGGFRVTYTHAMRRAWIVRGRVRVKAFVRRCVTCSRTASRTSTQIMAPLPESRVTPSRPFSRCGVDYAGPFQVLSSKGRGIRSSKGYVAVFVCLSTKAIHLELVGDLTTASYLGALNRFSGRRGRPVEIWSDNATNFRGARDELRQMLRQAELDWDVVADTLASEGIRWQFIPPSSPHFGGLWEAGVKSMKNHLRRVSGPKRLTYEEFTTLLVSVEAVLNSRPLGPISGDLDDLDALTPAHFLIGGPLLSCPQPCNPDVNLDHATHWQLVKGMRDKFWVRWSVEYLNTLQQRLKWDRPRVDFKVGDLVLIVDPSLLKGQGRWPIGRITQVFPGSDHHVRVVKIRAALH